jgi:hypothetical protein
MSFREYNDNKLPTVKECIRYIETTYGGCTFLRSYKAFDGNRVYVFNVPARTWSPVTFFTTNELRHTQIFGW